MKKNKTNSIYRWILLFLLIPLLLACEALSNKVDHSSVSVDTNAHYAVYQKAPTKEWIPITSNNLFFGFKTVTFTVDDEQSAYGIVFVCPSSRTDRPHEVHVYYSTKAEMSLIDFNCRKPVDEIIEKPLYGNLVGVRMGDISTEGEYVRLALSSNVMLDAWEAYAAIVRAGTRDIVAVKGSQPVAGEIEKKDFLIRRKVQLPISDDPFKIDIDFSGSSLSYFNKAFDSDSESTVNITGASAEDVIKANIGFLSRNKTQLNLVSSNQSSFTFLPVPLEEFTGVVNEFVNRFEFNPGEGHELLVSVSADDKITREVSKFFTTSEGEVHALNLPKPISAPPLLALRQVGGLQSLALNWRAYQDDASGITRMYRWVVDGFAAPALETKPASVAVEQVRWHINVTPGWLNTFGITSGEYTLVIPTHFEGAPGNVTITDNDFWRQEWSFQTRSPVGWQMSAISVTRDNKAEAVIDYLLNRNFDESLQFSQVYTRSTSNP